MSGWVHFWAVANELKDRGHTVTVLVPRYPTQPSKLDSPFKVIRLAAPAKNAWGLFCYECALLFQAVRIIRQVRPDVMLVRGAGPGWFPGLIFALFRLLNVPVVLECNGIVWQEYAMRGMSPLLVANIYCSAWQQALLCNEIIGVTEEITEAHRRLAWRSPRHAHVVPNGVHVEPFSMTAAERDDARRQFQIPERTFVAGYVGVFSPWHHVEQMVGAARLLHEQARTGPTDARESPDPSADVDGGDIMFVLIGDGALFQWSVEQQKAHGLANLRLTGAVTDRDTLIRWISCFDVGLSVYGRSHGSSLKAFEYMAAGIPVIGAGFPQIVQLCRDEGIGIGLATGSAEEIADAVREMSRHREHWHDIGRRNRLLAESKYSWQRVAEQVESVIAAAKA